MGQGQFGSKSMEGKHVTLDAREGRGLVLVPGVPFYDPLASWYKWVLA